MKIIILPKQDGPNLNGRIYTDEVRQSIVDQINSGHVMVRLRKPEHSALADMVLTEANATHLAKEAQSTHLGIEAELVPLFGPTYNKIQNLIEHAIFRPFGTGEINNKGEIHNYTMLGIDMFADATKDAFTTMKKQYIGQKLIEAVPMNRQQYNDFRGWELPADENPRDDGYLVTYLDTPDGYQSWSPKSVFEDAYREVDGLTFGIALEALKRGQRVARKGWNGKNMFLFLLPGGTIPTSAIHDPMLRRVIEKEVKHVTFQALDSICMFTADKKILTGWLASQSDMLAEDWEILNDE